jgi:hypothetical protein
MIIPLPSSAFQAGSVATLKAEDPEVPESAGEIGFSYFEEFERRANGHQEKENPRFLS